MPRLINFCSGCFHNLCGYGVAVLMWVVHNMPKIDDVAQQVAIPLGVAVGLTQLIVNLVWIIHKIADAWSEDESQK